MIKSYCKLSVKPQLLRAIRNLKEQSFQLVSEIMLVSMKPIFQIRLRNKVI